jgi:NAD(P)-dependent dehydrogenase (short-subunit alcohol dehydrogenase family)
MLLQGRVAIVTGAGRGIGAAVARALAREGAGVVVNDLGVELDGSGGDIGPAREVAEEIRSGGGWAMASTADVADHAAARGLVEQAIREFGRLDVLVNAAGILRDRMVFNMSEDEWDAVIRVHLRGTFNTTRHAAAYWRQLHDPGAHHRLINFTSVSGLLGAPGQPNYAAAKMGIVGFTYSCANALAPYGVTANAISPSAATRMTASVPEERRRRADQPERTPENVAPAVVYVASERSDWLNGQVIGAAGFDVTLWSRPRVVSRISSEGPWDLEHLARLMEDRFRPALEEDQG